MRFSLLTTHIPDTYLTRQGGVKMRTFFLKTGIVVWTIVLIMLFLPNSLWAAVSVDKAVTRQIDQTSSLGSSRPDATPPAAIPWSELGAQASKQSQGKGVSIKASETGAHLETKFQRLAGEVGKNGLWLWSTVKDSPQTRFSVKATGLGRQDGNLRGLETSGRVQAEKDVVRFLRPGLVEEYSVSVDGVRQDFVIAEPPPGQGDLRVELSVTGAMAQKSDHGVILVPQGSERRLAYHRLHVVDARNQELQATMAVESSERLTITVADAEATYPVRIDPTFSDEDWVSIGFSSVTGVDYPVHALAMDHISGHLYAGGGFDTANGVVVNSIAKWDGSAWSPLGSGMNDYVYALALDGNGHLYAGGDFTTAGGVSANYIAKWDGANWSPLGSGMDDYINALALDGNGHLYAGGVFTTAGGVSANYIAKWDGANWSPLGSGMNNYVDVLTLDGNGHLFAGGPFTTAGGKRIPFVASGILTNGSLTVTIEPEAARTAGAQWRRTGTPTWYDSGYTEPDVPTGTHTVEFKPITGWTTPANQDVTINDGLLTEATGTYTAEPPTGGTISGHVYQEDGLTAIEGAAVAVADYTTGQGWGGTTSAADGSYTLTGLPAGQYRVNAWASGRVRQYWQNTVLYPEADAVSVTSGNDTPGIDFQLGPGGSISGTVLSANPGTPLENISVNAELQGSGGIGTLTGADGAYTLDGLPFGQYKVSAPARWGSGDDQYVTQYYDHQTNPNNATLVTISSGIPDATGVNFDLSLGGAISGHVYEEDGVTPIPNLHVYAVDSGTGTWLAGLNTAQDGSYSLVVPSGTYKVRACASCNNSAYVGEWYDNVYSEADGTPIPVSAPNEITGIDFLLATGSPISGKVTTTGGTPISNVWVGAYAGKCWSDFRAGDSTDANGDYSFRVLAGSYYIFANASASAPSYYINEWWTSGDGTTDCNQAQSVTDNTSNINFALADGGGLSGTVRSDASGATLEGVQICAFPFPGGPWQCTTSQSNGTYTLTGVPTGFLRVQASGGGYVPEYYDNSYDPNWATAVWATAGQTTTGIDFSMGVNGSISGAVYQSDGETPMANVCVGACRHPCATNTYASARTDANGAYTIPNLPPQDYYLRVNAACASPQHYELEWWDSPPGTGAPFCDQAGAVMVNSGLNTPGVNFFLDPLDTAYPGPAFNWALVFSAHHVDGSIRTEFVASITGPSPVDVSSFRVTGPSETYNLNIDPTPFSQIGNFYSAVLNGIAANGAYTFEVTDSLGRTAAAEALFTYDDTLPQVDAASMKTNGLGNGAYVGTATPTLTWDPAPWPGTPGYYQAFIYDYNSRAIWYYETTEGTSVQVPAGYLQPDTAYYWWVRTCDIPATGERGQNRRYSESCYFYTGIKDTPDLSNPNNKILSFFAPDNGWANWFGITRTNLAPWDIGLYNVTGPEGTVYPFNGFVYAVWHPMFYQCWSPGPAPTPDGSYTFQLEDRDQNWATLVQDFVYNPPPAVPEATRFPDPNAYIYTRTPTFTWGAPSVGINVNGEAYEYTIRIHDYHSRVALYSSPTITETSFTLPEEFVTNAPPGCYRWEIRTFSDPTHDTGVFSPSRTFTIPPLADYLYTLPGGTGVGTDYRMFTVPLYLGTGAEMLDRMEAALGPYDPTQWRAFAFDGVGYIEMSTPAFDALQIVPGMAFWIISIGTPQVPLTGGAVPHDDYWLNLKANAWHQVGLPWTETGIDPANIAVTDGTDTYYITDGSNPLTGHVFWEYTGIGPYSGYEMRGGGDTLIPGTGYWLRVLAEQDVTLIIPPDNATGYFSVVSDRWRKGKKLNSVYQEPLPPLPPGG
jgi:hypothetical protein